MIHNSRMTEFMTHSRMTEFIRRPNYTKTEFIRRPNCPTLGIEPWASIVKAFALTIASLIQSSTVQNMQPMKVLPWFHILHTKILLGELTKQYTSFISNDFWYAEIVSACCKLQSTGLIGVDWEDFLFTNLMQVSSTYRIMPDFIVLMQLNEASKFDETWRQTCI